MSTLLRPLLLSALAVCVSSLECFEGVDIDGHVTLHGTSIRINLLMSALSACEKHEGFCAQRTMKATLAEKINGTELAIDATTLSCVASCDDNAEMMLVTRVFQEEESLKNALSHISPWQIKEIAKNSGLSEEKTAEYVSELKKISLSFAVNEGEHPCCSGDPSPTAPNPLL